MSAYTKQEQEIADRTRLDLANAYMNQVGETWDDCCDQAERAWGRCLDRANYNVVDASEYARDDIERYGSM